jgi:hypothetical protein
MSEPFIFIGTHRLKAGKLEAARDMNRWLSELVESNEPRVIAFNTYANDEGTEISVIQVHPDADSMLFHMELLRQHITGAYEEEGPLAETTSVQLYGDPGETVLEMIKQFNPGVPLTVMPHGLGGFTRSAAAQTVAAT